MLYIRNTVYMVIQSIKSLIIRGGCSSYDASQYFRPPFNLRGKIMNLQLIISIYMGCLGACIASFCNLVAYRLPNEESIVKPGSHCGNCNRKLKFYENIPILAYIFLGGKCKTCKTKIGIVDFLIELSSFLFYFTMWYKTQNIYITACYCIAFSFLVLIGYIDYKTHDVYIVMPIIAIVSIMTINIVHAYISNYYGDIIVSTVATLVLIVIFYLLGHVVYKGKLGDGDVYIFSIIATTIPSVYLPYAVLIACLSGISYVLGKVICKKMDYNTPIAFGPHAAIGYIALALYIIFI